MLCGTTYEHGRVNSVTNLFMQTFNEFFIRELKPGARPIAYVGRDDVAVCAADCRLMAFKTAEESLRFWIKVLHILKSLLYFNISYID